MSDVFEVWVDTGEVVERSFTSEEAAQRAKDLAEVEAEQVKAAEEAAAADAARVAALAHARSLGFTDAMIKVMYPTLIVE